MVYSLQQSAGAVSDPYNRNSGGFHFQFKLGPHIDKVKMVRRKVENVNCRK